MFGKLFGKARSKERPSHSQPAHFATFSAQFPPPDVDMIALFESLYEKQLLIQSKHRDMLPAEQLIGLTRINDSKLNRREEQCLPNDALENVRLQTSRSPLSSPEICPSPDSTEAINPMYYSCYDSSHGDDIVISETQMPLQQKSFHKSCESGVNFAGQLDRVWQKYHEHLATKDRTGSTTGKKQKPANIGSRTKLSKSKTKKSDAENVIEVRSDVVKQDNVADAEAVVAKETESKCKRNVLNADVKEKMDNTRDSGFESPKNSSQVHRVVNVIRNTSVK